MEVEPRYLVSGLVLSASIQTLFSVRPAQVEPAICLSRGTKRIPKNKRLIGLRFQIT